MFVLNNRTLVSIVNCNNHQIRNASFHKVKNWYSGLVKARPKDPPFEHITQIGDPILRKKCDEIPEHLVQSKKVKYLVKHMKDISKRFDCIGLSAPQVGVPLRLFIMEFSPSRRNKLTPEVYNTKQMSVVPFTVMINPVMKVKNYNKIIYPEICESVRGFSADVSRFQEVELTALNEEGKPVTMTAHGWVARIIQHEMDHLDGKLYTDSMDRKTLTCTCWEAINANNGKLEIPFYSS